jgi:hypothetical protein
MPEKVIEMTFLPRIFRRSRLIMPLLPRTNRHRPLTSLGSVLLSVVLCAASFSVIGPEIVSARENKMDHVAADTTSPSPTIATCVDAPIGARGIFWIGAARSRVLTCVRPLLQLFTRRGPVWEFAERVQITAACFKHVVANWFSRSRLADRCAIPSV